MIDQAMFSFFVKVASGFIQQDARRVTQKSTCQINLLLFAQRKILRLDSHLLVSGRQLKNSFKFLILCIGNLSSTNNVFSDCTWKNEVRIEKIT